MGPRRVVLLLLLAVVGVAVSASAADERMYERQHGDFRFYTIEITTGRSNGWMTRVVDEKGGNTCYVYDLGRTMSCVPGVK